MSERLRAAMAKLLRDMPRNLAVIDLSEALEEYLTQSNAAPSHKSNTLEPKSNGTFDKKAYQREYMRKRRAAAK